MVTPPPSLFGSEKKNLGRNAASSTGLPWSAGGERGDLGRSSMTGDKEAPMIPEAEVVAVSHRFVCRENDRLGERRAAADAPL